MMFSCGGHEISTYLPPTYFIRKVDGQTGDVSGDVAPKSPRYKAAGHKVHSRVRHFGIVFAFHAFYHHFDALPSA